MEDQDLGSALPQEIGVVIRTQCCTGRDGDCSDLHHAKVRGDKLGTIREKQENPLFFLYPEFTKPVSDAANLLGELRIGKSPIAANNGCSAASTLSDVAVDKVVRDIKLLGEINRHAVAGLNRHRSS
jgi:hypothetical protein